MRSRNRSFCLVRVQPVSSSQPSLGKAAVAANGLFPLTYHYIKPFIISSPSRSVEEALPVSAETYSHCAFRSLQMLPSRALFHPLPLSSLLPRGNPSGLVGRIVPWPSTIHSLWTSRMVRVQCASLHLCIISSQLRGARDAYRCTCICTVRGAAFKIKKISATFSNQVAILLLMKSVQHTGYNM